LSVILRLLKAFFPLSAILWRIRQKLIHNYTARTTHATRGHHTEDINTARTQHKYCNNTATLSHLHCTIIAQFSLEKLHIS
jgi:hypothetical protein